MEAGVDLKQERYLAARKATLIGVVVNVFLSIGKIVAGIAGNSAAILADGIHSASDLITDGVVLISMRASKVQADDEHPYGHGKFETLATQFISLTLLLVAFGICFDAVGRLQKPDLEPPTLIALIAAFVSLISKEAMFQYTIRVGRRLNATALIANAWHQRSDAISSIAAMVGIGGAMMGWPIFDPLAAIAVAFILGKVGIDLFRDSFRELTDSTAAIDKEVHKEISGLVESLPEVLSAHAMTPRRMGPDIIVDVHVVVPLCLTASEGHQVADRVRKTLLAQVEAITQVMVHVDTENDEKKEVPLMARREILQDLVGREIADSWSILGVNRLTPHYATDGIDIDLVLDVNNDSSLTQIHSESQHLSRQLIKSGHNVREVRISLSSVQTRRSESD